MKKITLILAALLVCGVALRAEQDVTLADGYAEVRDPVRLKAWLEANASDAETRLSAVESGTLPSGVTVTGEYTAISTNEANTNVLVTVDAVIDGEHIADDTIDNDSIDWSDMTDLDTDGTVTWGNITEGELGANKVTSANIKDGVVDSDNIADGTVTLADVNVSGLTGVGNATAEDAGSAVEYVGAVHSVVYTFTNVVLSLTNGADNADSAALLTFPEGRIYVLGAAINATVACTTNVWEDSADDVFFVGIGTAAAAQDATLSGTEQDIIEVTTLDTVAAGNDGGTVFSFDWEADMTAGADSVFDGTASAVKLYANTCVADTSLKGDATVTITGSARFHYIFLGDD